ncbi:hypothetical protein ACJX0J_041051, partial [Zea mays]
MHSPYEFLEPDLLLDSIWIPLFVFESYLLDNRLDEHVWQVPLLSEVFNGIIEFLKDGATFLMLLNPNRSLIHVVCLYVFRSHIGGAAVSAAKVNVSEHYGSFFVFSVDTFLAVILAHQGRFLASILSPLLIHAQ